VFDIFTDREVKSRENKFKYEMAKFNCSDIIRVVLKYMNHNLK